jgi:hypothetical protein
MYFLFLTDNIKLFKMYSVHKKAQKSLSGSDIFYRKGWSMAWKTRSVIIFNINDDGFFDCISFAAMAKVWIKWFYEYLPLILFASILVYDWRINFMNILI